MKHKTWEHNYERQKKKYNGRVFFFVCVCVCVCVCVPQVCTDEGEGADECINLPQISTVVLGLSQPSSHLNNMMPLFPQMLLRGSFLPPLPLPEPAICVAPSYPVALPFHHNDEMDVRWCCDHQRTLSSRRLLVTEQANSRRSTQGRAQERARAKRSVQQQWRKERKITGQANQ